MSHDLKSTHDWWEMRSTGIPQTHGFSDSLLPTEVVDVEDVELVDEDVVVWQHAGKRIKRA